MGEYVAPTHLATCNSFGSSTSSHSAEVSTRPGRRPSIVPPLVLPNIPESFAEESEVEEADDTQSATLQGHSLRLKDVAERCVQSLQSRRCRGRHTSRRLRRCRRRRSRCARTTPFPTIQSPLRRRPRSSQRRHPWPPACVALPAFVDMKSLGRARPRSVKASQTCKTLSRISGQTMATQRTRRRLQSGSCAIWCRRIATWVPTC